MVNKCYKCINSVGLKCSTSTGSAIFRRHETAGKQWAEIKTHTRRRKETERRTKRREMEKWNKEKDIRISTSVRKMEKKTPE